MRVVMGERERVAVRWIVHVVIILLLALAGVYEWQRSSQAERALCALRADIQERNEASRKYLKDVAEVRRQAIPGITTKDIEQSIRDRERTLKALSVLDC